MSSTWMIALSLFLLILIPRIVQGRTPQERDSEENPRLRHARRSEFRADRPLRSPSQGWALRR